MMMMMTKRCFPLLLLILSKLTICHGSMEKVRPRGNKRALIQSHLAKLEKNVGRRKLFHDLEFCYEVPDSSLYCDNFQLAERDSGGDGFKFAQSGEILFNATTIIGTWVSSCVTIAEPFNETLVDDYCDMFLTFDTDSLFATVAVNGVIGDLTGSGLEEGQFLVQGAGGDFVDRYNGYMFTSWHGEVFAEVGLFLTADDFLVD